jgi:hypothetical protein
MGLRDRLRRVRRMAEREMVVFELEDGTTARFYQDEFLHCCVFEWDRGRRHYFGEEPGPPHPIIEALRKVSDEELLRILSENGMLLEHLVAQDRIMREKAERPGQPVRESEPGVYE